MIRRYEHAAPVDLLHLDIKKLGRIARPGHRVTGNPADHIPGAGWEYGHVAIDVTPVSLFPLFIRMRNGRDRFPTRRTGYYARLGIRFKAILTDNGSAYRSYLGRIFRQTTLYRSR